MNRYKQMIGIIYHMQPKIIIEVGTHKAVRPNEWKNYANFTYYGFDIFENGTKELNEKEMNGKGFCKLEQARDNLAGIPYVLYHGMTKDTLPEFKKENIKADFAFIDGGHSIETIQNDWDHVKDCIKPGGVVVFDDYYSLNYPKEFGCNEVVKNIEHEVMPVMDLFPSENGNMGIQLVKVRIN